ncbi:TPA: hypothetical protein L4S95_006316 [Pseudomonas aeruginosa]|uniref:hypothetical protein n=1 Tax=Pseudomonas aeruginosa TaxID=287 RepID=UPI0012F4DD62|nr:hypothetical protein [Pseudomonas aeruginosa]EIU4985825.1 hypothetical protein [Pseudomonas aeruginosa]EKO9556180.1 hypothetical protein [Pseudomonas aeruginosa]EKV4293744.1 hypothetical protein [Pseudomonas aeruginosa]EKV4565330.1 hypothetical protein [Pseudomonas aeruginosa]EKV4565830.1 hypothetical protein [Pseudomonas aeruginosa]
MSNIQIVDLPALPEVEEDRALALLVLSIVEPSDEPSYLRIELQEESLPGNPDTE